MRSFAVGTEAVWYSVMGKPHCRRKGTDLTYRVISVEQGKPVSLLERGSEAARLIDGDADNRSEKKQMSLCNGADIGCVIHIGNITGRESGLTSPRCFTRKNLINRLMRQSR
jgi:hypothetical protein